MSYYLRTCQTDCVGFIVLSTDFSYMNVASCFLWGCQLFSYLSGGYKYVAFFPLDKSKKTKLMSGTKNIPKMTSVTVDSHFVNIIVSKVSISFTEKSRSQNWIIFAHKTCFVER